jgi:hypothetical protein
MSQTNSNKIDKIDTNIEHYTISELLTILDLDKLDPNEINEKTDTYINKFEQENNKEMVVFFNDMKDALIDYYEDYYVDNDTNNPSPNEVEKNKKNGKNNEENVRENQIKDWFQNQTLKQTNPVQRDKVTERKQKIDVFNDTHLPMNRQELGISNNFNVGIAQDVLNPNLKNITSRIIVLDSQYRQNSSPNEIATNFTLDLSEPLLNVISLRLYSFSIPYTWYNIDKNQGNTCFWISINTRDLDDYNNITITSVQISLNSGNYDNTTIVSSLINSMVEVGIDLSGIQPIPDIPHNIGDPVLPLYINPVNGKMILNLYGAKYNNLTIDETSVLTFFDVNDDLTCGYYCNPNMKVNTTLGWTLGYRVPVMNINKNGNQAVAIIDLYGPKYFILVIDDLNQNHINSGLIGITELSKIVKLPSYYSSSCYECIPPNPSSTNVAKNSEDLETDEEAGLFVMDKLDATYSYTQRILPSAPRTLTQAQIYSVNEILKNNRATYDYKSKAPVFSDTFAILPIKLGSSKLGDMNVEFGGSMQDNKRIYFGPVNISRIKIKLLDDKGFVVNLNGCDWCVTIISENLYQY